MGHRYKEKVEYVSRGYDNSYRHEWNGKEGRTMNLEPFFSITLSLLYHWYLVWTPTLGQTTFYLGFSFFGHKDHYSIVDTWRM